MKILIFLFAFLSAFSCEEKDKDKYLFIEKIMKEPERLTELIDSSQYYHSYYRRGLLNNYNIQPIIEDLKKYYSEGYEYIGDKTQKGYHHDTGTTNVRQLIELMNKSRTMRLTFLFTMKDGKWVLGNIIFGEFKF